MHKTTTPTYQLAQFNISKMRDVLESPTMKGFVDMLAPVHELADKSPGFVWRYQESQGDSSEVRPYPDPLIAINLTVWDSVESLKAFTYKSQHLQVIRDGKQWFEPYGKQPYFVMWWIPAYQFPTVEASVKRLEWLQQHGASDYAFGWKQLYPPPRESA